MNALRDSLNKNLRSYGYAIKGIRYVFCHENNILYQTAAAIITITLGYFIGLDRMEWVCIIVMIGLVIDSRNV